MAVPPIRLGCRTKSCVLPHCPQSSPVHGGLDAPGERKFARAPEVPIGIGAGKRGRNVWRINHIRPVCDSIFLDTTPSRPYNEAVLHSRFPETDILYK